MDGSARPSSSSSPSSGSGASATYYYALDDTAEGCYRDITNYLSKTYGFVRTNYKKTRSKLEKKRLPIKELPVFIWCINEKDIDFADLKTFQITNHFECVSKLTTKTGFTDMLRDCVHISKNMLEISPRAYNLGDPMHREDFLADYKISAAIAVLRIYLLCTSKRTSSSSPPPPPYDRLLSLFNDKEGAEAIISCITALTSFLRIYRDGEWQGVERNFPMPDTPSLFSLTDALWNNTVLRFHYHLISVIDANRITIIPDDLIMTTKIETADSPRTIKIKSMLQQITNMTNTPLSFQHAMGGYRNVWILKPPDTSCGIGIKVFNKLEDIQLCERGLGGRVAQKYVEEPFLVNIANRSSSSSSSSSKSVKFDLRVWVLVLSIEPLVVYVYDKVYGRHCLNEYDYGVESLSDSLMHLTNYSVQRKSSSFNEIRGSSDGSSSTGINAIRKLKSSVGSKKGVLGIDSIDDEVRGSCDGDGDGASMRDFVVNNDTNLLLSHADVVGFVNNHRGGKDAWGAEIWPKIKEKILTTLKLSKQHLNQRHLSFELLGYDVILDSRLEAWLLEVNMSPALAHNRSDTQNALIRRMAEQMVQIVLNHKFNNVVTVFSPNNNLTERSARSALGDWDLLANQSTSTVNYATCSSSAVSLDDSASIINSKRTFISSNSSSSPRVSKRPSTACSTSRMHIVKALSSANAAAASSAIRLSTDLHVALDINNLIRNASSQGSATANPSPGAGGDNQNPPSSESGFINNLHYSINNAGVTHSGVVGPLSVVGTHLPFSRVVFHDSLIDSYSRVVLVQRFMRKMLGNLRRYHSRRRICCILIQRNVRRLFCVRLLMKIKINRSVTRIQRMARVSLAKRILVFKRQTAKSITIQRNIRRLIARRLLLRLRESKSANILKEVYRAYRRRRVLASARSLVELYRLYSTRRRFYKIIVARWVKFNYIRRRFSRNIIGRHIISYIEAQRRHLLLLQKINCKIIANYAVVAHEALCRRRECALFDIESKQSYYYNKFINEKELEIKKIATKIQDEYAKDVGIPLKRSRYPSQGLNGNATLPRSGQIGDLSDLVTDRSNSSMGGLIRDYDLRLCAATNYYNLDNVELFISKYGYFNPSEMKALYGGRSKAGDSALADINQKNLATAAAATDVAAADDMTAYVSTYFERRNELFGDTRQAGSGGAVSSSNGDSVETESSRCGRAIEEDVKLNKHGIDSPPLARSAAPTSAVGVMRYSDESFREMKTLLKYYKNDPSFLEQFIRLEKYQRSGSGDGNNLHASDVRSPNPKPKPSPMGETGAAQRQSLGTSVPIKPSRTTPSLVADGINLKANSRGPAPLPIPTPFPNPAHSTTAPSSTQRPLTASAVRKSSDDEHKKWLRNVLEEFDGPLADLPRAPIHPLLEPPRHMPVSSSCTGWGKGVDYSSTSRFQVYANIGREKIIATASDGNHAAIRAASGTTISGGRQPKPPHPKSTSGPARRDKLNPNPKSDDFLGTAARSSRGGGDASRLDDPWGHSDNIVRSLQSRVSAYAEAVPSTSAPRRKSGKSKGRNGANPGKRGMGREREYEIDSMLRNYIFDNSYF